MRSWKLSLLFFSAVTLHGCLSGAAEPEVQDERSIRDIINLYNKREGVTYLYKYLDQISITPLEGDENQRGFIIKETECLKSGNPDLSQCDFKPDGNVRVRRSSRRLCWRRHCWARLTGRFTLIARPSSNQKIPGLILV
ncbi:cathelicidin-related antimicrobial peptide Bf-CRAMP-like isoform X2 [Eleutherodactylus coqui]|uniref:cathelicidin-related antimicrobial peptide Bf-CRAMP-like isoform X2 n=1 Tax=Eleutherodactylus coqui TaxID=57060 RepID=UPI003462080C